MKQEPAFGKAQAPLKEALHPLLAPVVVNGKKLRRGYTTGMCAAAAAKGATLLLFQKNCPEAVTVFTPAGFPLHLEIRERETEGDSACCCVIKDAGDDPDVTDGLAICATAKRADAGVRIRGGPGVGVATRPGLAVAPGEPAINPVPRQIITAEVEEVLPAGCGVEITVWVPGGEAVATRTLNPRLGIVGGISILGTTGIVEPMSEEAYKTSLVPQITQALALGYRDVVLTPGRRSARWAVEKYALPVEAVIQMGNFVGFVLEECVRLGVQRALLFGHQGKLIKVAAGVFHTHNRVADALRETLAAQAALAGAERGVIARIWQSATSEEAARVIKKNRLDFLFDRIAGEAGRRAMAHVRGRLVVGAALTSSAGEILGLDEKAKRIGESLGWKWKRSR
ncbi:MAG: cobalt-precorrin-5B (C(1))-methyltransferase CbiD [Bacillota bacterium]